jgi:hypothetical protein
MLTTLDPELYSPFVVKEKENKLLYVKLLKALYGTLQTSLLFYKKFKTDLKSYGFVVIHTTHVWQIKWSMVISILLLGMLMI